MELGPNLCQSYSRKCNMKLDQGSGFLFIFLLFAQEKGYLQEASWFS